MPGFFNRSFVGEKRRSLKLIRQIGAMTPLLLSACLPPPPGVHEVLKISESGAYSLNGVSIPRTQLPGSISAEQLRVKTLFAEIVASPRADIEAVTYAVDALKAAQVRFAFIDEQIMNSGKVQGADGSKPD